MNNPVIVITDKVVRMIRSMVYLALRLQSGRGASSVEISRFLDHSLGSETRHYHQGVIERALRELHNDGLVKPAGSRWYLCGAGA